jgi:hypothetical protein
VALRTLVALVFFAAAVGKMRHWLAFQGVLANYRLLPDALVVPMAYLLPPVEALLALWLVTAEHATWAIAGAAALLCLFAVAMAVNLTRGRRAIDCGCFQSALRQNLSWAWVWRNVALALGLVLTSAVVSEPGDAWTTLYAAAVGAVLFVLLSALTILGSIVPAWRDAASRHPAGRHPAVHGSAGHRRAPQSAGAAP